MFCDPNCPDSASATRLFPVRGLSSDTLLVGHPVMGALSGGTPCFKCMAKHPLGTLQSAWLLTVQLSDAPICMCPCFRRPTGPPTGAHLQPQLSRHKPGGAGPSSFLAPSGAAPRAPPRRAVQHAFWPPLQRSPPGPHGSSLSRTPTVKYVWSGGTGMGRSRGEFVPPSPYTTRQKSRFYSFLKREIPF